MKSVLTWSWSGVLLTASLVLLLLWVRSYWYMDRISYFTEQNQSWTVSYSVRSVSGVLRFDRVYRQSVTPQSTPRHVGISGPAPEGGRYMTGLTARLPPGERTVLFSRRPEGRAWGLLGFGKWRWDYRPPLPQEIAFRTITDNVSLPYWLPTLLLGIWPALKVRRWLRQRRASRAGLCRACGYDLRASGERCPECGTPVAPPPQARVETPELRPVSD